MTLQISGPRNHHSGVIYGPRNLHYDLENLYVNAVEMDTALEDVDAIIVISKPSNVENIDDTPGGKIFTCKMCDYKAVNSQRRCRHMVLYMFLNI